MRALYLDESSRDTRFYFFGGLLVDDDAARAIESGLNGVGRLIAQNVAGFDSQTEFHGNEMFHGEGAWDKVPVVWRVKASELVAKVIERSNADFIFRGIDLLGLSRRYVNPYPAHLLTLAHLLEEADSRVEKVYGEVAVVLADQHHSAANSRRNLLNFKLARVPGYTQKQLGSLVDTIYFGPSDASRLLQATDVATYYLNRNRTIKEKDPRSSAAVGRIAASIRRATVQEYVWYP